MHASQRTPTAMYLLTVITSVLKRVSGAGTKGELGVQGVCRRGRDNAAPSRAGSRRALGLDAAHGGGGGSPRSGCPSLPARPLNPFLPHHQVRAAPGDGTQARPVWSPGQPSADTPPAAGPRGLPKDGRVHTKVKLPRHPFLIPFLHTHTHLGSPISTPPCSQTLILPL